MTTDSTGSGNSLVQCPQCGARWMVANDWATTATTCIQCREKIVPVPAAAGRTVSPPPKIKPTTPPPPSEAPKPRESWHQRPLPAVQGLWGQPVAMPAASGYWRDSVTPENMQASSRIGFLNPVVLTQRPAPSSSSSFHGRTTVKAPYLTRDWGWLTGIIGIAYLLFGVGFIMNVIAWIVFAVRKQKGTWRDTGIGGLYVFPILFAVFLLAVFGAEGGAAAAIAVLIIFTDLVLWGITKRDTTT